MPADTAPTYPSRPSPGAYLQAIRRESARFRAVLAATDPMARVPACPAWDAGDLLWHLAEVQAFWAARIRTRPRSPEEADVAAPERASSYTDLLAAFDTASLDLSTLLEAADPAEPAWSWADHVADGQTVGFTLRRQAHEALIHRLDAEDAAGVPRTPLDPGLAADGVAELLEVMYGGAPPAWAAFTPNGTPVRIELTDVGRALTVAVGTIVGTSPEGEALDGPHLVVVPTAGADSPGAVVRGTAADVDVAWWKRSAGPLEGSGDADILAALAAALDPPLD